MDLISHLTRQAAFGRATFGPGPRTEGVLKHIESEMKEVRDAIAVGDLDDAVKEWTDIVILGLDGLLRAVRQREEIRLASTEYSLVRNGEKYITNDEVAQIAVESILWKQGKNEQREYPDWRGMSADVPIEHDRAVGVQ
jgi:hypothetical protein